MTDSPQRAVVLVHGLWMPGTEMALLRRRLRACGLRPYQFAYPSVTADLEDNARRLARFVSTIDAQELNFVGHSLGGLVILSLLARYPEPRPGRVVLIGTPFSGCHTARCLSRTSLRWILGRSREALLTEGRTWAGGRELGVIAGDVGIGFSLWLSPRPPGPHDGAVTVEETRVPGMTDHIVLKVFHTGMLFSRQVARQVCAFLNSGRFERLGFTRTESEKPRRC